jgi:GNAT superfamily N-acetyltransferase
MFGLGPDWLDLATETRDLSLVMDIKLAQIEISSPLYPSQQHLRDEVLRKPIGRELSATDIDRDRAGTHFVAVHGNEVVACVGFYPDGERKMRLRQMAVSPTLQGQGVGARLLAFAETWARGQGVAEIKTHARVSARGFYERSGFVAEGAEFEEVTIPHIAMRKRL